MNKDELFKKITRSDAELDICEIMYMDFCDEFKELADKYISKLMDIENLNVNDLVKFIFSTSNLSSSYLLIELVKKTDVTLNFIENNFIPETTEATIELLKSIFARRKNQE
jgi:hypothetical protein